MWISSGDRFVIKKYDKRWIVVRHNKDEHPREVRTNRYAVAMYIAIFALRFFMRNNNEPFFTILMAVIILSIPFFAILTLLKWRRNNKELDIALLIGMLGLLFIAFIMYC